MKICLPELPYPPTVNTYWRRVGNKTILSAAARKYRDDVAAVIALYRRGTAVIADELFLTITFRPPDLRKRDLDNLPKGLLDALKHAGVYSDDSQIRRIDMQFGSVQRGGAALVTICPFLEVAE